MRPLDGSGQARRTEWEAQDQPANGRGPYVGRDMGYGDMGHGFPPFAVPEGTQYTWKMLECLTENATPWKIWRQGRALDEISDGRPLGVDMYECASPRSTEIACSREGDDAAFCLMDPTSLLCQSLSGT